ncbi:RNA polymerase sigma factor [Cupriavidus basilensis]|uniref:RNA polymerase sigma factor n=1 Tax=Cupriavidus basilensis TaxID=68895 RepID=A0ABT6AY93_9BURK|nr:RNA polymerase sigma factor [Cupriavidus basilensis]MDF3837590.1 RNA polymerase sigma factor [Cupriavidus basilensis]
MTEDTRPILSEYLARHYGSLKQRVTRLLGNGDLAGDALHDTWLRLQSKDNAGPVQSPGSYLVRVAVNIALDVRRRQSRSLPFDEIESLMALSDSAPGPAQTAELRSEVEEALRFIDRMPERRRQILMLVRWEGLQQKEVAARLGVSLRIVENELKRAHDYLDAQMHNKKNS